MPDPVEGDSLTPTPTWVILAEIKAALSSIQTSTNFIREEQGAVRQRLHDLSGQIQPLMGIPEQMREMKRDHEDLRRRLDSMVSLSGRVDRIEPLVNELDATRNRGRGAIWAVAAIGTIAGAILGFVSKWFAPHS